MNPTINQKLEALRTHLEFSPEMGKTPVVNIKPIPVKSNRPVPTVRLPDEEPDENDCKRVGSTLKTVFGRKMCIEPTRTAIVGTPAVARRVREALDAMRDGLEAQLEAYKTMTYGNLPSEADFEKAWGQKLGDRDYLYHLKGNDALTAHGAGVKSKGKVASDEMYAILQKLVKANDEGDDDAGDLASDFLTTLGIEWI